MRMIDDAWCIYFLAHCLLKAYVKIGWKVLRKFFALFHSRRYQQNITAAVFSQCLPQKLPAKFLSLSGVLLMEQPQEIIWSKPGTEPLMVLIFFDLFVSTSINPLFLHS
jgi:hypothetical protein